MAGDELVRRGWHLSTEGIAQLEEGGRKSIEQLIRTAVDIDLKDIGDKWLPEELHKGKLDYVQGPAVLQLMKLRNISAPKENEESQAAPRLLRLSLTDGHNNCTAIEVENLKNISLSTPPGTKVMLEGAVDVENSFLLLNNKNFRCLGGNVEKLVETWDLKRKLAKQFRSGVQSEGGPPLFVPFGKRHPAGNDISPRDKKENFKSLETAKKKEKKVETEFEQQRQATIAEALQEGKTKTFGGGGKPPVSERDVARITEMGFTVDQATNALRQTNGSVDGAISFLISGGGRSFGPGFRSRPNDTGDRFEKRGPRENRPGHRGRNKEDETEDSSSARPSGPATLFDFLEDKIPVKEEAKSSGATSRRPNSSSQSDRMNNPSNSGYQSKPQYENSAPRSSTNYKSAPSHNRQSQHDTSEQNFRKNNLPPRLANKHDGGQSSGYHQKSSSQNSNGYDSERTMRDGHGQGRSQGQYQSNRPTSGSYDRGSRPNVNQSRPKSAAYSSSNYNDRQDYPKENRYDSRQDSRQGSRQDPPQNKYENRFGNQRDIRQQQKSYDSRNQGAQDNYRKSEPPSSGQRGGGHSWKQRDVCLAKYWEDDQFYPARVEDFAPNGATCVVTFLDYGNMEEVFLSDIKQFPQQPMAKPPPHAQQYQKGPSQQPYYSTPPYHGGSPMGNPPPFPGQEVYNSGAGGPAAINSMEFRRNGNGVSYQGRQNRQDRQDKRPTQQFYQPRNYQS